MVGTPTGGRCGSTLAALARLYDGRPGRHDPASTVAAWYEAKAAVHVRLAAECGDELERAAELGHALAADEHARRLWGELEQATAVIPLPRSAAPFEGVAA